MKIKKITGFTLVEILIVVAIIGILISIAIPGFLRARENSRGRACQENLQKIDGAVEQWALENNQSNGSTVPLTSLWGATLYIKREPICPSGGTYGATAGAGDFVVGGSPTCSIGTTNAPYEPHVIQ